MEQPAVHEHLEAARVAGDLVQLDVGQRVELLHQVRELVGLRPVASGPAVVDAEVDRRLRVVVQLEGRIQFAHALAHFAFINFGARNNIGSYCFYFLDFRWKKK